jgi:hypothetical protein
MALHFAASFFASLTLSLQGSDAAKDEPTSEQTIAPTSKNFFIFFFPPIKKKGEDLV